MNLAKYIKVFDIGLQNTFVYRWNFFLRSLFNLVPLAGTVYIWRAMYAGHPGTIGGYTYPEMIFYFVMAMIVNNLATPTEDEWQIAADIRDGLINSFLTKPLNYLGYRISLFLSYRLLYTLVTIVPVAAVVFFFRRDVTLPAEWVTWIWFALSLLMAAFIQFFIAYSLAMMAFWILEISTVVFLLFSFEYFLSGQIFPLDIMPASFQGVLKLLPFYYEIYFPIRIFQERALGGELYMGLVIQAAWFFAMLHVAQLMWRRGTKHYQAVGG